MALVAVPDGFIFHPGHPCSHVRRYSYGGALNEFR